MKKLILQLALITCISDFVPAQTISFSNEQKSAAAAKETFNSNEFIYARADLGGKTIKEYFKIPDKSNTPYPYLYYIVEVYKGDNFIGDNNWNIALLKDSDLKLNTLSIDVLPDPGKATTVLSGTQMFDAGLASAPLYTLIQKQYFNEAGSYTIKLRIYNRTQDAYGNDNPYEKWPIVFGSFTFVFNEDDVATLLKNGEAAAANAKKASFK